MKSSWNLWEAWCILSVVGIWPRHIEPRLLKETKVAIPLPKLKGLKIFHFSDLHFSSHTSPTLLNKILKSCQQFQPDLIVFTGDFLSYSTLFAKEALARFLDQFKAPLGCYAVLGNHDYASCVEVNRQGDYDVVQTKRSEVATGLKLLFSKKKLTNKVTEAAKKIPPHQELLSLVKNSPFKLLHNENKKLSYKEEPFYIAGLGEHMMGRSLPDIALAGTSQAPKIVLAHHPDSVLHLENTPSELILSGHTHGGQINLPWMWKKFTQLHHQHFKRGLFQHNNHFLYVSRGVSAAFPFRWFARPEITLITLGEAS